MIDDDALRRLAADQYGLVTVDQARSHGITRSQRARLADGRRWERVTPRVLRLVGVPTTRPHRLMLAVLDAGAGAALEGSTATTWWGIPGGTFEPVQVVAGRGHVNRPARGVGRHEPTLLMDRHIVRLEGIPTVVPARALFEVAGSRRGGADQPWWIDRMARMVDTAWAKRLVSGKTLHQMLDDLAQRGRPGIQVMRAVLADRPLDYEPPASGLESRLVQLARDAGLPTLRRQVNVGSESGWIGRVDFRAADAPLIVEVQSERFHASLIDQQLDGERISRLRAAGFVVVELTDVQVWHRPQQTISEMWSGFAAARRAA